MSNIAIAAWAEEQSAKAEAVRVIAGIAETHPDVVLECAEIIREQSNERRTNGRAEERQKKLELIIEVLRMHGEPMSYKEIMEDTGLSRSAIRNIVETQYREVFEVSVHEDGRTLQWWLVNDDEPPLRAEPTQADVYHPRESPFASIDLQEVLGAPTAEDLNNI